jgi:putative FmdB family regulatory protein
MPIYEYACNVCGHKFDQLMKMGASEPPCPKCGEATRKLVSASGFILKGGGWYKDHYGLKSSSGGGESSSSSASVGKSESSGKSDSAPAAKSDAAPAAKPASTPAPAAK